MPLTVPTLQTERLTLRPIDAADAADLVSLMSDAEALRYWDSPPWTDPARADRFVARCGELAADDEGVRLGIVRRSDDGFAGWCALHSWNPGFRSASLTYCLTRDSWGRGLATEAAGALLDWGYATWDLNRVQAEVDTRNPASARVLEKLGFCREGELREDCVVDGIVSDSWVYGLLRRDRPA